MTDTWTDGGRHFRTWINRLSNNIWLSNICKYTMISQVNILGIYMTF